MQSFQIGQTVWLASGASSSIAGFVDDEDGARIGVRLAGFPASQFFAFVDIFATDPTAVLEDRSERIEPVEGFVTQEQLVQVVFDLRRELAGLPGPLPTPDDLFGLSELESRIDALSVQLEGLAVSLANQFSATVERLDLVDAIIENVIVPQQLVFLNRFDALDASAREAGESDFANLVLQLGALFENPLEFLFVRAGDKIIDEVFDGLTR